jgi:hypothetical protein
MVAVQLQLLMPSSGLAPTARRFGRFGEGIEGSSTGVPVLEALAPTPRVATFSLTHSG